MVFFIDAISSMLEKKSTKRHLGTKNLHIQQIHNVKQKNKYYVPEFLIDKNLS